MSVFIRVASSINKILLYDRINTANRAHFIRLVNPNFTAVGEVRDNWFIPHIYIGSSQAEWQFTAGTGYAEFTNQGLHLPLVQTFPNSMVLGLHYDVTFTVTGLTQGCLEVRLGSYTIGNVCENGDYTRTFYNISGQTPPTNIAFYPRTSTGTTDYFDGAIAEVAIRQNTTLSPLNERITYDPKGYLDLYDDEAVGLTYQVSDVRSISKRFGGYSKTFKLPFTDNNKQLLGHLHTNEAVPKLFDPRNKTKAAFISDDVTVLSGYLSLKNVTRIDQDGYFEVEVYDGTFGLLDALRGKKLSDLDLTRFEHILNIGAITQTWGSTWDWNKGFFYPLYFNLSNAFYVNKDFTPAFYSRMLLDRIFYDAGYSYTLSSDVEQKLNYWLHCPIGKRPKANDTALGNDRVEVKSNLSQNFYADGAATISQYITDWTENHEPWRTNVELMDPNNNSYYVGINYFFVAPYTGEYSIDLNVDASLSWTQFALVNGFDRLQEYDYTDDPYIAFEVYDYDSSATIHQTPYRWVPPYQYTADIFETLHFSSATNITLQAGQKIAVRCNIKNHVVYKEQFPTFNRRCRPYVSVTVQDANSHFYVQPAVGTYSVGEGMTIVPKDWIGPTISQEAFLNDLIKCFNLYLLPDKDNERQIHILSRTALYSSTTVLDRSGKVALDQNVVMEYLTEVSSSVLHLGYKDANEKDEFNARYEQLSGNKQYGDKDFYFNTDIFNDEENIRLSIYTPTPILKDGSGRYVPAVFSQQEDTDTKLLVRSQTPFSADVAIKYYSDIAGQYYTSLQHQYPPTLHIDKVNSPTYDINFGEVDHILTNDNLRLPTNNLFTAYYRDQLSQYRDGRLFTVYMTLTNQEVLEHIQNIGARIFISELNNWFILYSIIDFDPTLGQHSLTKVQLLESPPSEKKLYNQGGGGHLVLASSSKYNPVEDGTVVGPNILKWGGAGGSTTVYNTNLGPNNVYGYYNNVTGSGNTIYYNTYNSFVTGNNNTINGGLTGVTILGGEGVNATSSNTIYLGNNVTINNSYMSLYSSVTINSIGMMIGGTGGTFVTSTGITINGVEVTSAITVAPNLDKVLRVGDTATGQNIKLGTYKVGGGVFSGGSIVAGYQNAVDTSSYFSSVIAGSANTLTSSISSVILGGEGNQNKSGSKSSSIIGGRSNVIDVGIEGSAIVAASGITANKNYTLFTNRIDAQEFYSAGTPLSFSALQTVVQAGTNINVSGSTQFPVVSTIANPYFNAITGGTVVTSGITATTYYSGSSSLGDIIGSVGFIQYSPLLVGVTDDPSVTYGKRFGSFKMDGNLVHFTVNLTSTSMTKATLGDEVRVTLPMNSAGMSDQMFLCTAHVENASPASNSYLAEIIPHTSYMTFRTTPISGSTQVLTYAMSGLGALNQTITVRVSGSYERG